MSKAFSPKQARLLKTKLPEVSLIWGASGSGKTFISNLLIYGWITSRKRPGLALFSGYTSDSLYDNVVKPMLDMDAGIGNCEYIGSKGGQMLKFRNGVEVRCVGANSENAQSRIQGKNIILWYGDEITKQPRSFVDMALGRCRAEIAGEMRVTPAVWTFNADHPSHFIKTEYLDSKDDHYREWMFELADNPLMTPDYIARQKKRFSGVYFARMVENKWTAAEGAVYDSFNRGDHVIAPPEWDAPDSPANLPYKRIHRWLLGVDWGYEHPMSITLFGEGDGVYYAVDEIYIRKQLVDETLAKMVKAMMKAHRVESVEIAYGDSARPEYIMDFQRLTGIPTEGADKAVHEGISSVQRHLHPRDEGGFGLYISSACTNLINEMETYCWLQGKGGTKDEPAKVNDHAVDGMRYVVYSDCKGRDVAEQYRALPKVRVR